ncbi:MAG: DUF4465 domain-containing protein [Bacteroides sp.]|nr:DUF4465 domain-containing protein [Bacteroides sp.]
MKKNYVMTALLTLSLAMGACYDDDDLWNKVDELETKVEANAADIATLSALVDALNQGKVIVSTEQTENGYVLTFSDGSKVEVVNGRDGKDGTDGKDGADGSSGDSFFTSVEEKEDVVVITLADGRVIELPKVSYRVLTFEDEDVKFAPYTITGYDAASSSYYSHSVSCWTDLVDTPEYGGPLTYGDMGFSGEMRGCDYYWCDDNNTFLASELPVNYGSRVYWSGGHVVSNYASEDYTTYGTYSNQQTVYGKGQVYAETKTGGHNGSANFAMHYGYRDNSPYNMTENLPCIYFKDNVARVIDHMYVNNSCYAIACYMDGNGLTAKIGEEDWVKVVATGYGLDGKVTGTAEVYLCDGPSKIITEWTKWELAGLGKVWKVEFNITGSSDNGYGFSQPAYFAYDDVAVRF